MRFSAAVLALALVLLPADRVYAGGEPRPIENIKVEGPPWQVRVNGTVGGGTGNTVIVSLIRWHREAARVTVKTVDGRYEAVLGPFEKQLIAGEYIPNVQWTGDGVFQGASRGTVQFGRDDGTDRYIHALRRLNVAISVLATDAVARPEFVRSVLREHRASGRPVPQGMADGMLGGWKRYADGYLKVAIAGIRMDLVEYQDRILLEPIEGGAATLAKALDQLAIWAGAAGRLVEAEVRQGGAESAESDAARKELDEILKSMARSLGQDESGIGLRPAPYALRENGTFSGGKYLSNVLPFEALIPAGWKATTLGPDPTIRLLMRKDGVQADIRVRAWWWGEIPAETFADRLMVMLQESWPAFRLRKGPRTMQADDLVRVETQFQYTASEAGPAWNVKTAWTYDPSTGTAYGIECMSTAAGDDALDQEFEKAMTGFAVKRGDRQR